MNTFRAMCAGSLDLANGLERATSRLTEAQCNAWADNLIASVKIDAGVEREKELERRAKQERELRLRERSRYRR